MGKTYIHIKGKTKGRNKRTMQTKNAKTLDSKGNTKILKTFRFEKTDLKRLKRISTIKKAPETRVVTELIRIAYAGMFMPQLQELDKFYKQILQGSEARI